MLYSVDHQKYVDQMIRVQDFKRWTSKLSRDEYDAIILHLNDKINEDEIHTSSWMPGKDWSGTVFDPIYQKACDQDPSASAKCFGLLLWSVVQNHSAVWGFGRYKKNDTPIEGLTYFILKNPPPR